MGEIALNRILKVFLLMVVLSLFSGCTNQEQFHSETKNLFASQDWDISAVLEWNDKVVVGKATTNYLGTKPLTKIV